jgi:DNA-binding transcriptional ArsR family regulator
MSRDSLLWSGARKMRVELDKKSLFALASDTRLEMLKSLQPMRRTVSQLSEELGIDKGAIHRHLKKMEEGGLVKRFEDHGFVYYGLTWKARDLISPNESTRVVIILSAMWIVLLAAVIFIAASALYQLNDESSQVLTPGSDEKFQLNEDSLDRSYGGWFSLALLLGISSSGALILFFLAYRIVRKPLQGSPEKSTGLDLPDQVSTDD